MPQSRTKEWIRAILGGLLLTSWLGTFYSLFSEYFPPLHILLGFAFLSTATGVLFTYWRGRHVAKIESETWDPVRGRWVAVSFVAFYLVLSILVLILADVDRTLSNLIFASITGASFGFLILARRIPPFAGSTPWQTLPLHGFVMLASAAFTVIGILFVLSHDQSTWLGFFILMILSASLSYYFGEPLIHQPT